MKTKTDEKDLARQLISLTPAERDIFLAKLTPAASGRVKQLISDFLASEEATSSRITLLPHQRLPEPHEIVKGAVLAGGRGAGKTLAAANYLARIAENTPKLRARVIAPTLSDAVNAVALDPQSGILTHSPSATFRASGVEGARIEWPNGAKCFLVGTPTLKDVDRLRALTNIDIDHYEEAAANPRLKEAVQQADLSRRGTRLDHPIWIASTTPRPVDTYKEWLKDPDVTVTRAGTAQNPHTPQAYRDYAESLKGTHLYRQEILGEVVDDVLGALWTQRNVDRSVVKDETERQRILSSLDRVIVGVDPPSGHGTCGIIVAGVTNPAEDPTGNARIVVLDDYSVSDATPNVWGGKVVDAALAYGATIVAERNQGGLMVEDTIRRAAEDRGEDFLPVTLAHARLSKAQRASPMALLWELENQRGVILPPGGDVKRFAVLIDQMVTWIPGATSPDHLDAAAWATAELMRGGGGHAKLQPAPQKRTTVGAAFRRALMGQR